MNAIQATAHTCTISAPLGHKPLGNNPSGARQATHPFPHVTSASSADQLSLKIVSDGRVPRVPLDIVGDDLQPAPVWDDKLSANDMKQTKMMMKWGRDVARQLEWEQSGKVLNRGSRLFGVIGHSGRAVAKFEKGKYLDATREGAKAIKDAAKLVGEKLPSEALDGINGVIALTVVEDFFQDLMAMIEDPGYAQIDRFMARSTIMLENLDDLERFGQLLIQFVKTQGPALAQRLKEAILRSENQMMQLLAKASPALATEGGKQALQAVSRLGSITAVMVAGLDVGRAILAGLEAYEDRTNPELMGRLIKRTSVAVLSVASVAPGAGLVPGLIATGLHFVPDRVYTYLGQEMIDTLNMDPQDVSFLEPVYWNYPVTMFA